MDDSKSNRIDKNFHTSDNQNLTKIWLPAFSIMIVLNPKADTVQRKFEKCIRLINRPAHFFVVKNRVCFGARLKTKIKLIKNR